MFTTKLNDCLAGLTAIVLLAGCASFNHELVLDRVGPGPFAQVDALTGTLIVYSAFDVNADFNSRDSVRHKYSDYQILAADGHLKQWVHNSSGTILQRPRRVELAPGGYSVLAEANGYGVVKVPVKIEAGRDTIVHLEGGITWPSSNQPGLNSTNSVRLPGGEMVGWKG